MTIRELKPSPRVKGRWLVFLEDGSLLRITEREMLSFALYAGMELDEETLEALNRCAGESTAKQKALSLVTARPYAKRELERRLTGRGFEQDEARAAADWLEDIGLLDDGEYAKALVRHYAAKGYGFRRMEQELFARGIPKEFWQDALDQLDDPCGTIDAFLSKRLAPGETDPRQLKKAADALARRGFAWHDISQALRRRGVEADD